MVFFYRSPAAILLSTICSIAVAAFIYFVIVKPETDRATNQVDKALKQSQPAIDNANRQLEQGRQEAERGRQEADKGLDRAQRITNCIQKAQGDVNKIAACNR